MTPVEASDRRRSFCARLKSERERRGTSLATIAESTKIKASLLEALERGDLSRWPKGLYRRAFFREYVAAIGLPMDQTVSEFAELLSDGEAPPLPTVATAPPKAPETLRLLLGPAPAQPFGGRAMQDLATRLTFAVTDISCALLLAWMLAVISAVAVTQTACSSARRRTSQRPCSAKARHSGCLLVPDGCDRRRLCRQLRRRSRRFLSRSTRPRARS